MTEIRIGSRTIGDGHPPMIVAEIGIAHKGSAVVAAALIDVAAQCGAQAVKIQSHIPSAEMTGDVPSDVHAAVSSAALSHGDELLLKHRAEKRGAVFLSTPFSVPAVDRLEDLDVAAYKVGSGELTHAPMLRRIAQTRKPVLLSTGMATFGEIWNAIEALEGCEIVLMHCVSIYPTPYERVQLHKIDEMRREFSLPVGISDHSRGIYTALGAVALGACVVEKHFMLEGMDCPDADVSITPNDLRELVSGCAAVHAACKDFTDRPFAEELEVAKWARHSLTVLRPVRAGEPFTADNLGCKRPGTGMAPARLADLMGKLAARELPTDTQITEADIV